MVSGFDDSSWISEKFFSVPQESRLVCLLDRDDTLIHDLGPLTNRRFPRLMTGCVNELRGLSKALKGRVIFIIVTNQSRIEKGYSSTRNLRLFHFTLVCLLAIRGVRVNRIISCPHKSSSKCKCRKPEITPITDLLDKIECNALPKYFLGDAESDVETGHRLSATSLILDFSKSSSGKFARVVHAAQEKSESMEISFIILKDMGVAQKNVN